jgi:TonB-linked SusC/RagA family outer membrane protein
MKKMKESFKLCFLSIIVMTGLCSGAYAQKTVTGTIPDEGGEEIIGASVQVTGTTQGTVSDLSGHFSIDVPESAVLVISYIGYQTQEIPVANETNLLIRLKEEASFLDEVVVVGYGTQKKASLTSAIYQIKGEDVFKDRGTSNVSVALQGEVPGLVVTRTTTRPGSEGVAMKIRGDISVNGNSSPLVLIDGATASLDELNQMNPNDIENISVLKDASAAIYGSRSASGVVLVTTKRGKGKAKVVYNGSISTTIDGIQTPLTNNYEWLDMWYEAKYQDARANNQGLTTPESIRDKIDWWIFKSSSVMGGVDANGQAYDNEFLWKAWRSGEVLTLTNAGKTFRYTPDQNMKDILYGQATSHKHNLSVSGGDDKFGYMASLGYADNNAQLKVAEDGEKRYNGRLNMDYQATKMLKLETSMAYDIRNITTPSTGVGEGWTDPWLWPVYNENGDFYDTFGNNRNPVGRLVDGGQIKNDWNTFRANLVATLDLEDYVSGLSLQGTAAYKEVGNSIQTSKNKIQYYDWVGVPTGNFQSPGSLSEQIKKWTSVTTGAFVRYEKTFADVHKIAAMAGMTAENEDIKNVTASRNNGPIYAGSGLVDLDVMVSGTNNGAVGGQSAWSLLSYISRISYNYSDRYLLELLGRRDGSSKLHPDQRWKNFYSVSGGWVLSNEEFMKSIDWLTNLKIRYNYGKTGSVEGIDNYEQYATLSSGTAYFGSTMAPQTTLALGAMTSSSRTWETIVSHNTGLDFSFLKDKLYGSFDYYSKQNNGMFIPVTYPSILGASAPKSNNGKFGAKGWEFALGWRDRVGDFSYNISGFIADAKSEVLELENNENVPAPGKNSNRLIGKPREAIYVFQTAGLFQTQAEADAFYDQYYWVDPNDHTKGAKQNNILPAPAATGTNRLRPGARILVDYDGDGAITNDDVYYAGDAAPHLTFGIKAGMEWKGIDVSAFFQGVGQQTLLRTGNHYAPWVGGTLQNTTFMGQMWSDVDIPNPLDGYATNLVEANVTTNYAVPSFDANFGKFNYLNKDVSVQDSKYIRLKSLVIGYTLPQKWTSRLAIGKARFYFSGDDLWEWTKVKDGYDPEYGEATNGTYPFSRLLSIGLDITF